MKPTDHPDWYAVDKKDPCPICGKPDWCLLHRDGVAVICPRISEGCVRDMGEAGFLHRIGEATGQRYTFPLVKRRDPVVSKGSKQRPDFAALTAIYVKRAEMAGLDHAAGRLGVTLDSLRRLRAGYIWTGQDAIEGPMTFPMQDYTRNQPICGIRIRAWDGRKYAVKHTENGLFISTGLARQGHLLICEGPTDTAAMLGLGYNVIGRPSCTGGVDMIRRMLTRLDYDRVSVMADDDGPGLAGAQRLGKVLLGMRLAVKVVHPGGRADVRDWVRSGATPSCVDAVIGSTPWFRAT